MLQYNLHDKFITVKVNIPASEQELRQAQEINKEQLNIEKELVRIKAMAMNFSNHIASQHFNKI